VLATVGDSAGAELSFKIARDLDPEYEPPLTSDEATWAAFAKATRDTSGAKPRAVSHTPTASAEAGKPLALEVKIENDTLRIVRRIELSYRKGGAPAFVQAQALVGDAPTATIKVPADMLEGDQGGKRVIEYYFTLLGENDFEIGRLGDKESPFVVKVTTPAPPAPVVSAPLAAAGPVAPVDSIEPPASALRTAGKVTMWVGIVSLLGGIGTYAAGKSMEGDLEAACKGGPAMTTCPADKDGTLQGYNGLRTTSMVGIGLGIPLTAIGVVLQILAPDAPPVGKARASLRPWIGPGGAGLHGSF
jgi:hypothetical protein